MKIIKTLVALTAVALLATACGITGPKSASTKTKVITAPAAATVIDATPGVPNPVAKSPMKPPVKIGKASGKEIPFILANCSGEEAEVLINSGGTSETITLDGNEVREVQCSLGSSTVRCYVRVNGVDRTIDVPLVFGAPAPIVRIGPSAPTAPTIKKP